MTLVSSGDGFLETIHCCAKTDRASVDPKACLGKIRTAVAAPVKVLKNDGMKQTLKAYLAPWGEICLQDFRWNPKRKALSPLRWSRGKRIWHYAGEIAKGGVPVLEPLAYLEIKKAVFVTRTFIVTPWLEDQVDLGKIAQSERLRNELAFDQLLDQAVHLVHRLHSLGFLHGDLKWSNFVCAAKARGGLILTDLDGLRRSSSAVLRGRDYARFALSAPAYGVDWISPENLMARYLSHGDRSAGLLEWSIKYHVARKMRRYQKDGRSSGRGPA